MEPNESQNSLGSFFAMNQIQRITSASNPLIRLTSAVVHIHRRAAKEGLFTVEGLRLAEMAAVSDWKIRCAFLTENAVAGERAQALLRILAARRAPVALIPETMFSNLSETESQQGILLLMERGKNMSLRELVRQRNDVDPPLYIVLDRVQDPGNVGTILRTADAAGASGVILLRGSADVYSGKVVRATMGALFHVPFAEGIAVMELMDFVRSERVTLCAAACDDGACMHYAADLRQPLVIVFGNEANGVSEELLAASEHIYIPMCGSAESLNVSAAVAAVLYEAMRQRFYTEGV